MNEHRVSAKVWDLPVRVIHWLLVLLIVMSWLTAEFDLLPLHHLSGYLILALVITRIAWGFIGSTTARFTHFVKGPKAVAAYAAIVFQRGGKSIVGHNPLGALSIVAMLGLLLLQTILGLFSEDADGVGPGPLADLLTRQTGRAVADVHELVFNVLLFTIALHIAAVLFHTCYKRDTLIRPMFTGRKILSDGSVHALRFVPSKWALVIFAAAFALVLIIAAV
ncbi:MAG: cytochrome b/b6 domain-containing protein [Rhodospirillaceae bacterium]|nr:cytochrome b/b6 domain-containing protein [Rhodospirillaceae bacterium]